MRRRFVGASMLLVSTGCQVLLGDFTLENAPSEARIELGDACEPNTYVCDGAVLKTCSNDRTAWTTVSECDSPDHCDPTAGACRTCTAGDAACNGNVLETCNAMGQWQEKSLCDTPELCTVTPDRKFGSCKASPCDQAEHICAGNLLERCSPGRDRLTLVDRCASAALCDVSKADAEAAMGQRGTCRPPQCLIGQFACDGATLERCNDDLKDWQLVTVCGAGTSCNPQTGSCDACSPGDVACSGAELLRCDPSGWALADTCAAPELCDTAAKRCQKPTCATPGDVRCVAGEPARLEECGTDLRWAIRENCTSLPLCSESAGRCLPPACQIGETRCVGQERQVCSDDRSGWVHDRTCRAGETCDATGCHAAGCSEGMLRCNDAAIERCASGAWVPQNRCAAPSLCSDGASVCQPLQCDPAKDFTCSASGIISGCTAGVANELKTCGEGQFCDPELGIGSGRPSCDKCQPLAFSCDMDTGTELHRCLADGSSAPLVERCAGGCTMTGNTAACVPVQ